MSRIVPQPQRAGPDLSLMLWSMPFRFRVVATLGVTGAVETRPKWPCDVPRAFCLRLWHCPSASPQAPPRLVSGPWLRDERSAARGSPDSRLLSGERTLLTFLFSEKSRLFI